MITSLDLMVEKVLETGIKHRIAVAWAHDSNTVRALGEAVRDGFAEALMVGEPDKIIQVCRSAGIDPDLFKIISSGNEDDASHLAVRLVKNGDADIIMKGLLGTDKYLKAIMDKENGLMLPDTMLSYVGAIEIPEYHKLLFVTDPAVIPYPDLSQKIVMAEYAIEMARKLGVDKPRIALLGASEKPSRHFRYSEDYQAMCRMAEKGEIKNCIMDGPLDLFLACDRKSLEVKGIGTPVGGDADILLFPSLEACNPFYKGLMLFAKGKIAGLIRGTQKPVILMSRNESEKSKYYCIALSCLMV
ncbi:MAG: phosphate butyryltransferase [Bacteroidales bacterium]|nr:phosphate butyryltransferase [Bacteroidales bacterium]